MPIKNIRRAIVCFHAIVIPTVHSSKYAFFKYIDKALETGSSGFSSPSYTLWTKVVKILRSQDTFLADLFSRRLNFVDLAGFYVKPRKFVTRKSG